MIVSLQVTDTVKAPSNVTADAGCWNPDVEEQARELDSEAWVSTQGGCSQDPEPSDPNVEAINPVKRMKARPTRWTASCDGFRHNSPWQESRCIRSVMHPARHRAIR